MSKGSLREHMPTIAALIDDLRQAFGKEYIDKIIRAGISGKPVFFASENGYTVGTPVPVGIRSLPGDVEPPSENETNRERHYREARERYYALMKHTHVQTSAQPKKG